MDAADPGPQAPKEIWIFLSDWLYPNRFTLIHRPTIPCSYAILSFISLDFTFSTRHIHNWASFLLCLRLFILLELLLCSYPPTDLRSSSFSVISFCLFTLLMEVSRFQFVDHPPGDFMAGPMVTSSKRTYVTCFTSQDCYQRTCPQRRPPLTHTSSGDPETLTGRSASVSSGGHWLLSLGPGAHKILFVPSRVSGMHERTHWSQQTPSSKNTRDDSTHGRHQMVNAKIRLIIFFAAKDGDALYSQEKQDWELTVAQIMNSLLPNSDLNWRKWGKPLDHSDMT